MSDVLVIQNTRLEGAGVLKKLLLDDGFTLDVIDAQSQNVPQRQYSMGIILGGPQGANDLHTYLRREIQIIQDYVKNEIPLLGICLGSQLIAKAFGAKVYRGPKKEIGFYDNLRVVTQTKLFSGFDNPFTVFHWHGDTFDLPQNAIRLVSSTDFSNQAIQIGSAVGLQFHLEVDANMIKSWLDNSEQILSNIPYINPEKIKNEIPQKIIKVNKNMATFYKNFKLEFHL